MRKVNISLVFILIITLLTGCTALSDVKDTIESVFSQDSKQESSEDKAERSEELASMIRDIEEGNKMEELEESESESEAEESESKESESESEEDEPESEESELESEVSEEVKQSEMPSEEKPSNNTLADGRTVITLEETSFRLCEFMSSICWNEEDEPQTIAFSEFTDSQKEYILYPFINHGLRWLKVADEVGYQSEDMNTGWSTSVSKLLTDQYLGGVFGCDFSGISVSTSYLDTKDSRYYIMNADGEAGNLATVMNAYESADGSIEIVGYIQDGLADMLSGLNSSPQLFSLMAKKNADSPTGLTLVSVQYYGKGNSSFVSGSTSSFYTDEYGEYRGDYLFDDDNKTTWVPGGNQKGVGESVTIITDPTKPVYALFIANGYFKSEKSYQGNGRMTQVSVNAAGFTQTFDLVDNNQLYLSSLENELLYSDALIFGQPVYTSSITVTILGTKPGTKYEDVCVSDIYLLAP